MWIFFVKLGFFNCYLKCCRSKDGFEFMLNGLDMRYYFVEVKDMEIRLLSFIVLKEYFCCI